MFVGDPTTGLTSTGLSYEIIQQLQTEDDLRAVCYKSGNTGESVQPVDTNVNGAPATDDGETPNDRTESESNNVEG